MVEETGTPITVDQLARAVQRVAEAARAAAAELNEADGALGDGDLGITVSKGFEAAAGEDLPPDIGGAFLAIAKAFQRVSSSSYGTLVATAFMATARETKGSESIAPERIPALLATARDAMMKRGKGALGDKTVLDGIDALAHRLENLSGPDMRREAAGIVEAVIADFDGRPCRLGRARMFADKSAAMTDPGQLALLRIVQALN